MYSWRMNLCRCGCGTVVRNVWAHGHNTRKTVNDYVVTDNGCWEWDGRRDANGYGLCDPRVLGLENFGSLQKNGQRKALTHRVFYALFIGPIPDGLIVRHKCDNPPCVNPSHLEVGTRVDNAVDRMVRGRSLLNRSRKIVCKNGHSLIDMSNVRIAKSGQRKCRSCARMYDAKARALKEVGC